MRNPRIYIDQALTVDTTIQLSDDAFGHVVRVLRLTDGDEITLFNGDGNYYAATLTDVAKKKAFA